MGIILLLASWLIGFYILRLYLKIVNHSLLITGGLLVGILTTGTIYYLLDLASYAATKGGMWATIIMIIFMLLFLWYAMYKSKEDMLTAPIKALKEAGRDKYFLYSAILFFIFSLWLNYHTFSYVGDGDIKMAGGAWSDILYHNAFVRSIGIGDNIPVEYPYFSYHPMHYHFMFNYYCGKLYNWGLDSVNALNLLSSLSLTALLLLIAELGRQLFNKTTGILGAVFLIFHSSIGAFTFASQSGGDLINKIITKNGWLGYAPFEGWGLFNLNVFINRRNFAFGLGMLIFILLVYLLLEKYRKSTGELGYSVYIALGVIIGMMPYWNVIVATFSILFLGILTLLRYKDKPFFLRMLVCLAVAGILTAPQILMFKSGTTVLSGYPKQFFGYGAEDKSLLGIIIYYFKVLGLKPILIIASLFLVKKELRTLFAVISIPFILANVLQFGIVLYDNNQLLFVWLIIANLFAAYTITQFLKKKQAMANTIAVLLAFSLVFAGVIDWFAINNMQKAVLKDNTSTLKQWIQKSTKPSSSFMTNFSIGSGDSAAVSVTLSGRKLYGVRNDVDSSCDVAARYELVKRMYSLEGGAEKARELMKAQGVNYVIIDRDVLGNKDLKVDQALWNKSFKKVYQEEGALVYTPE